MDPLCHTETIAIATVIPFSHIGSGKSTRVCVMDRREGSVADPLQSSMWSMPCFKKAWTMGCVFVSSRESIVSSVLKDDKRLSLS